MSLIGIGLSGLRSHQTALSVTGNNVANASTEGYSRQEVVFEANPSQYLGVGYIGQGSGVETVRRVNQEFLTQTVRTDTTILNEREALLNQAEQVDNLLASSTTGLTPALSNFFQAVQGSSDDPTSVPQRQLVLTQAEGVVARFRALDTRLSSQLQNVDQELEANVAEFRSLAQSMANLNSSIAEAIGAGQGDEPNDLLDERDRVLLALAELVSVTTVPQADGQVNVFIGNGQPLVIGSRFTDLTTVQSEVEPGRLEIATIQNGVTQIISDDLTGGKIGGLLNFRDDNLIPAINGLGRVAIVLADTLNGQHELGMDLESNLGGLFFDDVNDVDIARARVTANRNNPPPNDQVIRVNIQDPTQVTTEDYELRFDGPTDNDVTIIRKSDSQVVLQGSLTGFLPANFEVDGLQIQIESGTFAQGDRFTLLPTRTGAKDIRLNIDRVEELAFASPIRAEADLGNSGTGVISLGEMLDVRNPLTDQPLSTFATEGQLSPPIAIRFINERLYEVLDYSDPANPVPMQPPLNNQTYVPGLTNSIFSEDPGQTIVSTNGPDISALPAPVASGGGFLNGYTAQNITLLSRDTATGIVTTQTIAIPADSQASEIATLLGSQPGVQANAYTHARLSNFVDDGDPNPIGITINGEALTVTAPAVFGPDELANLINANTNLQALDIYAVSDGTNLDIRSSSGADIDVEVTGLGDSVQVDKIDPYSAGGPSFATQVVTSGNGVAVGGVVDLKLDEGVSITSDAAGAFAQAPVVEFSYLGFQFNIVGEPGANDLFVIDYNQDGVSDNRNALGIAGLETQALLAGGVNTYGEAYSQIIEQIGIVTNQARLDVDSAEVLLQQSIARRESVSGVNLDEEAGRLIQFQAAYSASAQVISIAQELFDTLLGTFR